MANFNNVEIFEEGTIIELIDESDKPVEFFEIASIELSGKFYELLQPVKPMEGIGEDEAVILEYEINEEKDEKNFKPIFDEELLNEIFEEYLRALSDDDDEACGCGEGCDCCGGDCEKDDDCDCEDGKCDCEDGNCGCKEKK